MDKTTIHEEILNKHSQLYGQLNEETRQHSLNVAEMCEACGNGLNLNPDICYKIGLLHDVGKIFIPSRILKKNMKLTEIEREVINLHAYFGYQLIKSAGESPVIYIPILFHHGFTKPRLCEPDEPLTAELLMYIQLVHSVDIYDAMAQKRVYHEEFPREAIFRTLAKDDMCPFVIWNEILKADKARENLCTENKQSEDILHT